MGTLQSRVDDAREIERKILRGSATFCSDTFFGRACKGMWPNKTAEQLAALVGISTRSAGYQLSGEQLPAAQTIHAVVGLWLSQKRQ